MSPKDLQARFLGLPSAVVGAGWMIVAACLLGVLSVLVRHVAQELHPFEIAFFRNVAQLILMLPWLVVAGLSVVRTHRNWAHMRRSLFGICAMLTWFSVLTMLPIAEATAITFAAPLFTTAGAALLMGEKVGVRRWSATMFGFIGVLLIIRPGFQEVGLGHGLALLAAVLIAAAMLTNKSLARTEHPNAMVLWMGIYMTAFSIMPAASVWTWPTVDAWPWLAAIGLVATAAHLALNHSFSVADASFVAPFGFTQIPFIAVLGYAVYGEVPDLWTWAGAAVIVASGIYIARREAKVSKAVAAPPAPEVVSVAREGTGPKG